MPAEGTQPVILVHGTFANQYDSLARMAPELKRAGHCLYSFNYGTDSSPAISGIPGRYALDGLSENGDELAAFADTVRERTGSSTVDMLGWSQGGTIITDVLKKHGGEGVDDVVTFGATHHGTTLSGLALIAKAWARPTSRPTPSARPPSTRSSDRPTWSSSPPTATPCPVSTTPSSGRGTTR